MCSSRDYKDDESRPLKKRRRLEEGDDSAINYCEWNGFRVDVEDHMRECACVLVECPNQCDASIQFPRRDLAEHLK